MKVRFVCDLVGLVSFHPFSIFSFPFSFPPLPMFMRIPWLWVAEWNRKNRDIDHNILYLTGLFLMFLCGLCYGVYRHFTFFTAGELFTPGEMSLYIAWVGFTIALTKYYFECRRIPDVINKT